MGPGEISSAPLWLDSPYEPAPPLRGSVSADIAIVGGGITGLAAAARLAERGMRFVLLEQGASGGGASGRGHGLLLSGLSDPYVRLVTSLGRDGAREIWRLTRENHRRLAEVARRFGIECEYDPGGSCRLSASPQEAKELRESATLLAEDGFPVEFVTSEHPQAEFAEHGTLGGLLILDDAGLDPVKFLRALAEHLRHGVLSLHEDTPVLRWESSDGRIHLKTPDGEVKADVAILAAGTGLPALCPAFEDLLFPVRAQFCATAPVLEMPPRRGVSSDWGHSFFRQTYGGRLLAGGMRHTPAAGEQGLGAVLADEHQNRIEDALQSHFPFGAGAEITHRWAASFLASIDGLPIVGPLPGQPRVLVAGGYSGHDLGLGFVMGEAVADLVLDGRAVIPERFAPRRFL